jgi:hypothetical protein
MKLIKNGDLPANPLSDSDQSFGFLEGQYPSRATSGLTKREMFAMAAMQGLLSKHADYDYATTDLAAFAVSHADALLAELRKSQ